MEGNYPMLQNANNATSNLIYIETNVTMMTFALETPPVDASSSQCKQLRKQRPCCRR